MSNSNDDKHLFESKLGPDLQSMERVGGGRNSRVYRLVCTDGRCYAAKVYYRDHSEQRDRLQAEFRGLTFLWQNGVRTIPEPLIVDSVRGFAFYDYIEGEAIDSSLVSPADIDRAVEFLVVLADLKSRAGAADLPSASEACFSVAAVVENIEQRLGRLAAVPVDELLADELHSFLDNELAPFCTHVKRWSEAKLAQVRLSFDREVPTAERTLSPSDFGFHNAVRRPSGELVFLDFEHFGWDDPAKMIVDFLLHPEMRLPKNLKERYFRGLLTHFGRDTALLARLAAVYPLFGVKWCLILLNEFVPVELARRDFAQLGLEDLETRRAKQLSKAREMLDEVRQSYEQPAGFN